MPVEADVIYRDSETILNEMAAALLAEIPDAHVDVDGVVRLLFEIIANTVEGVYLASEIVRDNIFIQRANLFELRLHGEMHGLVIKPGTIAGGTLKFSGSGGTFIPTGTQVFADVGAGDFVYFESSADVTVPAPGIPTAPTAADSGSAGNPVAGTYEYVVTYVTAAGETVAGPASTPPLVLSASRQVNLTNVPPGGAGTTSRKIYRSKNGGAYQFVLTIANNVSTTVTDNVADGSLGGPPPTISTAEAITVAGVAEEEGVNGNVAIGTITEIGSAPDGVTDVTNTTTFTGGSDEENMEEYRQRLLEYIRNPQTGSAADLKSWAESIDGVDEATVFPNDNVGTPTNGHATVRISGPAGSIPNAATIAATLAYLQLKDIVNVTLHVATFTQVTQSITVDVTTTTGYTLADVTASVQTAILSYVQSIPVGGTMFRAGLIDAVYGLPGILNVTVTTPAADASVTATQKFIAGTISVV